MSVSVSVSVSVRDTRLYLLQALDERGAEVGRAQLRAYSPDQARTWAGRLLRWQVGAVSLAEAGWKRTRVRVAEPKRRGRVLVPEVRA